MVVNVMNSFTLRLPPSLRAKAAAEAEKNNRTVADELRAIISSHYSSPDGAVTIRELEAHFQKHVQQFHTSVSADCKASAQAPVYKTIKSSDNGFEFDLLEARSYLEALKTMLADGSTPTPSDLSGVLSKPSRRVGRILAAYGVKARNTRINGVSSRFFFPDEHIKLVDNALKEISYELKK